jgi:hypothetical protein
MNEEMNEEMNQKMQEREAALPMSCRQFKEALDDLDRTGMPAMMLREAALEHAETCGRCAQLMTDTEALDFSFHQIAAHEGNLQAPPRVEAALLQEFRAQRAAQSSKKGNWRLAALATAAAVLLALGFSLRNVSLRHTNAVAGETGQSALNAQQNTAETNSDETELAENVSTDAQDATGFVSLPYATDPGTLEGGTVVRVELTRATLASMGMPVADAGSLDRIPADIMLSEDGAPQAIRLVSSTNLGQ